jgi:hypothetical protein
MAIRTASDAKVKALYKFRGLANRERLEQIFLHQALYWPAISELNDPFESRPRIVSPPIRNALEKLNIEHQAFSLLRRGGMERIEAKRRSKAASAPGFLDQRSAEMTRELPGALAVYRIFSLAANKHSILLWSHYADAHAGICLGFSTLGTDFGQALEVCYSKDLASLSFFERGHEENLLAMALTKSEDWRYEQEFRLVSQEPTPPGLFPVNNHWYTFRPDCLAEVTLGCNIQDRDEAFVRELVGSSPSPIKLLRAVKSEHKFALDFIDA